jgi:hypothetical protein
MFGFGGAGASPQLGLDESYPIRRRAKVSFSEVFSPPRIAPEVAKAGAPLGARASWDLRQGWDSSRRTDVRELWRHLKEDKPETVWLCPECRAFSAINRINRDRMDPVEWQRIVSDGVRDLVLCMEIAEYQVNQGRYFAFEHPLYASSWGSFVVRCVSSLPGVRRIRVDMCSFGMQVDSRGLNKKPTGLLSNHPLLLQRLERHLCAG